MSLAALIAFYRTDEANDCEDVMKVMKTASVSEILKKQEYWGEDLSFMEDEINKTISLIDKGMDEYYKEALS